MTKHINASLALRQDNLTDQRFKSTNVWLHVDERDLAMDWTETFNLDANRSANFSARGPLISRV